MEKLYPILIFCFFITGCNIFDSGGSKKEKEVTPFEWREINYFSSDSITTVNTSSEGEMYIGGRGSWYISPDSGKSFRRHDKPDSAFFSYIVKHGQKFYAIGDVEVEEEFFSSTITITKQSIYVSETGSNWEKLIGPFKMYDIVFDNNDYLFIAKLNGVSAVDLKTKIEYPEEFYNDRWGGIMDVITTNSKGEVFVGCDGGIYKSTDRGKTWNHITGVIGKDYDDINFMEIGENDQVYSIAVRRLLMSEDDGNTWTLEDLLKYRIIGSGPEKYRKGYFTSIYPINLEIMRNGYMYTADTEGVYVAHPDSMTKFYNAGPEGYDFDHSFPFRDIVTFENGDVLVYNSRQILFGRRNLDSEFWLKRL